MPTLQIPDYLDTNLEAAAAQQGRTKSELVEQLLTAHVEEQFAAPETFTEAEMARFQKSNAQLDRGERIGSEQVEVFFKNLRAKLAAR